MGKKQLATLKAAVGRDIQKLFCGHSFISGQLVGRQLTNSESYSWQKNARVIDLLEISKQ